MFPIYRSVVCLQLKHSVREAGKVSLAKIWPLFQFPRGTSFSVLESPPSPRKITLSFPHTHETLFRALQSQVHMLSGSDRKDHFGARHAQRKGNRTEQPTKMTENSDRMLQEEMNPNLQEERFA